MPIGGLIRLAVMTLVKTGASRNIGAAAARISAATVCAFFISVLAIAAIGCAVAALWIYATPYIGSVGAPLAAAGALLTICLILALAIRRLLERRPAALRSPMDPEALLADAMRLFKEHKGPVLLAALIAGIVAANGRHTR